MAPIDTHIKIKIRPINSEFNCYIVSDGLLFESDSGKDLSNLSQNDFSIVDDYLYFDDWVMSKG